MIYDEPILSQLAFVSNGLIFTASQLANMGMVNISISDMFVQDSTINEENWVGFNRAILNSQFYSPRSITINFIMSNNRNWATGNGNLNAFYFPVGASFQLIYTKDKWGATNNPSNPALPNDTGNVIKSYINNNCYVFDGYIRSLSYSPFDQESTQYNLEIYCPDPLIRKLVLNYSTIVYTGKEPSDYGLFVLQSYGLAYNYESPISGSYPLAIDITHSNFGGDTYLYTWPFKINFLSEEMIHDDWPDIYDSISISLLPYAQNVVSKESNKTVSIVIFRNPIWHIENNPNISSYATYRPYALVSVDLSKYTSITGCTIKYYRSGDDAGYNLEITDSSGEHPIHFNQGLLINGGAAIDTFYIGMFLNGSGSFSSRDMIKKYAIVSNNGALAYNKPTVSYTPTYMSLDEIN